MARRPSNKCREWTTITRTDVELLVQSILTGDIREVVDYTPLYLRFVESILTYFPDKRASPKELACSLTRAARDVANPCDRNIYSLVGLYAVSFVETLDDRFGPISPDFVRQIGKTFIAETQANTPSPEPKT